MMPRALLTLTVFSDRYTICRLPPDSAVPAWAEGGAFVSITRTRDELSIVCLESNVPADVVQAGEWRLLKCEGPLHFTLTGIVASLAEPLAQAHVAIFPIATHDTDYLLVKEPALNDAVEVLTAYGHAVRG
jgi:uncharacterized protein